MKNRGFVHNITSAVIMAVFVSFAVMCIYWVCSGMKYGMQKCIPVLTVSCVVLVILFAAVSGVLTALDMKRLNRVSQIRRCDGYIKEYYKKLSEYIQLSGMSANTGILTFACALADGGRFSQAMKLLEETDTETLNSDEEESYFNTQLYCAVLMGDTAEADEIYLERQELFDKAVKRRKWYIVHTLGLYFQLKNEKDKAKMLFEKANDHSHDKSLSFECESALCSLELSEGNKAAAKEHCKECSRYADGISQVKKLCSLMKAVEAEYIN